MNYDAGRRISVVLFAGGRGAAPISRALAEQPSVHLRVVLNAYDDGLSTGVVRRMLPGMLGPSDIRKNFSNLLRARDRSGAAMADLLEARPLAGVSSATAVALMRDLAGSADALAGVDSTHDLALGEARFVQESIDTALDFLTELDSDAPEEWLAGMALGNLIFAGAYLRADRDFNAALRQWNSGMACGADILNVTDGTNLTLVGVKADGTYLPNEAAVVGQQSDARIVGLFLLPAALDDADEMVIDGMGMSEKAAFLATRQSLPRPNPELEQVIAGADLIVYGPGTQHSSLLPSYLTQHLGDWIAARDDIEKVFVSNLADDHEIRGETLDSLLSKVREYMSIGSETDIDTARLVTRVIAGQRDGSVLPWGVRLGIPSTALTSSTVQLGHWGGEVSGHFGDRVAQGLMTFVSSRASDVKVPRLTTLSVVVPVLNEVERVGATLTGLLMYDWLGSGFALEVVVVDGGSTDGSTAVAVEFPGVRVLQMPAGTGRGASLRHGLQACGGDVLVTFPSDGEYAVSGLAGVASLLRDQPSALVFGNRAALCLDTDERLREIYGGRSRAYYASKYGGFALSLACATVHKRWIADPLTSIKGFARPLLPRLSLAGDGVDWDLNLVVDARRHRIAVVEIPVDFVPRRFDQGKKIRTSDGLTALARTLQGRWRSP